MGRMVAAGGGLESATRALAVDLAPIRVNMIVLGAIQVSFLHVARSVRDYNDQKITARTSMDNMLMEE